VGHGTYEMPTNRNFGLTFGTVFLILASLKGSVAYIMISSVFYLLALVSPLSLSTPNKLWTKFGVILNSITTPIFMAVVFYLIVMPIGIIMRARGHNPLKLQFDKKTSTYWINAEIKSHEYKSMKQQF